MMNRVKLLAGILLFTSPLGIFAQRTVRTVSNNHASSQLERPKLVVGIVVDQMRWDFLYRYYDRYSTKGFKRLVNEGFTCENTFIPYTPAITAVGHSSVYTGSVPALHGIMGNSWFSREKNRTIYCVEDESVQTVGSGTDAGQMSPKNLLATTVTDELRLATNFRSKVVGIAIKDRGAILPAGHSANAAFWYDGKSGNFVSSSYYMKELPAFAKKFNDEKWPEKYLSKPWNTLYPIDTYVQSAADDQDFEGKFKGADAATFPHDLTKAGAGTLSSTPFGNSYTLEFAKRALEGYAMGKGPVTDMLVVSLSSTDYVGHQFGPNSIETEDTYLRLDKDLGAFFDYLDSEIGKGQYTVFLTADHGVAHIGGFANQHNIPGGGWSTGNFTRYVNNLANEKLGITKLVKSMTNYQVYFDYDAISAAGKTMEEVKALLVPELRKYEGVANVIDEEKWGDAPLVEPLKSMLMRGYNVQRSGDLMVILNPGFYYGGSSGASHGSWNPYDTHIPLVWMGWGIRKGASNRTVHMTDIAPTVAALLHIQMPNACIGEPIIDITNK